MGQPRADAEELRAVRALRDAAFPGLARPRRATRTSGSRATARPSSAPTSRRSAARSRMPAARCPRSTATAPSARRTWTTRTRPGRGGRGTPPGDEPRAARCASLAGRSRVADQRLSVLSPRPLRVRQLLLHPGRAGPLEPGPPAELAQGGHGSPADHRRGRPPRRLRARQPGPVSPHAAGDGLPDVRVLRAAVGARPRDRAAGGVRALRSVPRGNGRSSSSRATRPRSASGAERSARTETVALPRRATSSHVRQVIDTTG